MISNFSNLRKQIFARVEWYTRLACEKKLVEIEKEI